MKKKKVFINSNGCIPNQLEGKKIFKLVKSLGFQITNSYEKADLIIFNSCGFSVDKMEESCRTLETYAQEKNASAQLILTGCLDNICHDMLEKLKNTVIYKSIFELNEFFGSEIILDNLDVSGCVENNRLQTGRPDIFHVITSTGCLGSCSYCVIKRARGQIRSKSEEEILKEMKNGIKKKFNKFILWGDDIGAYGDDISTNIVSLLQKICKEFRDNNVRIYIHRINPQWLIKYKAGLFKVLASGLIKLFYSPIQSGSNKILELMNRNYSKEDIISIFSSIKKEYPEICLKTDMMIGFPSEQNEDFHDSLDLLRMNIFDDLEVFKFRAFKNTPAYRLKEKIDDGTINNRIDQIWKYFPSLRFSLQLENGKYSLIDKGNVNSEGLCWTLKNINPDYYD